MFGLQCEPLDHYKEQGIWAHAMGPSTITVAPKRLTWESNTLLTQKHFIVSELMEFIVAHLLGNCSICEFNTYFHYVISCQEEGTLEPVKIAFPLKKSITLRPTIKLRRTIA